ncbi:uncharacterized protein LOC144230598 isoform X2 [Crocuta crocuta]
MKNDLGLKRRPQLCVLQTHHRPGMLAQKRPSRPRLSSLLLLEVVSVANVGNSATTNLPGDWSQPPSVPGQKPGVVEKPFPEG